MNPKTFEEAMAEFRRPTLDEWLSEIPPLECGPDQDEETEDMG